MLGGRNPATKLTESQVLEIRKKTVERRRYAVVASEYGVTESAIKAIAYGTAWGWL
jgi:hypothetical protein